MQLVIVSGLLGVGKTSVIIDFLGRLNERKGLRIAVIENDIGKKGIDSAVLEKYGLDVKELKGGCICCTLKDGLINTLRLLEVNMDPDMVIIEPTGIADPEYIITSLEDVSGLTITSVKVVIVLDAERFLKIKKMFERPLRNQIDVASMVLINKMDTVGDAEIQEIEAFVRSLGFEGPVLAVQAEEGRNMDQATELLMG